MKRLSVLCLALVLIAGLVACGGRESSALEDAPTPWGPSSPSPGHEGPPVLHIGAIFTTSGPRADTGAEQRQVMEMWLDSRDWQIGRYTITLTFQDDGGTVETALDSARRLIEDEGVHLLFGGGSPHAPEIGYAIAEYAILHGIPYIMPRAAGDDLTQRKIHDLIIRTGASASQAAHPFGYWAFYELGLRRVGAIAFDCAFSHESVAGFTRTFEEAGGAVIERIWTPRDTTDFTPFLSMIPRDIDALFIQYQGADVDRVLTAIRDMDWNVPILAGAIATDERILSELSEDAALNYPHGTFNAQNWLESGDTPHTRAFADAFYATFGRRASHSAMEVYAGLTILEAGMIEAGGFIDNFAAFLRALRTLEVPTPKGYITLDRWNNPIQDILIRRVERRGDGELVNAHVYTFPDVSQFWTYDPEEFLALPVYDKNFNTAEHNLRLGELCTVVSA